MPSTLTFSFTSHAFCEEIFANKTFMIQEQYSQKIPIFKTEILELYGSYFSRIFTYLTNFDLSSSNEAMFN